MQFKNPEILYLLFLLIIPILIHLFQLQRFQKIAFTNVKLLKEIKQQTRKSSELKKLLILLTRILLFTSLIIAFSQPYIPNKNNRNNYKTFIYLDNSYSMQAKGEKGELLQRAKNELIENIEDKKGTITLITNNEIHKNINSVDLKNILINTNFYPIKKDLKTILLQINNLNNDNTNVQSNIVLISDFQNINSNFNKLLIDSSAIYSFIQSIPNKVQNISIDSVWISEENLENIKIKSLIKNHQFAINNLSISLHIEDKLFGKTTVTLEENSSKEIEFVIPNSKNSYGKISLSDNKLLFDNNFYFSVQKKEKINVLAIGENNQFLSKIFTQDEFNFKSTDIEKLDYGSISNKQLIILNELEYLTHSIIQSLKYFAENDGNLVVIPSPISDLDSYNELFSSLDIGKILNRVNFDKTITTINYDHPFFKNVFQNRIENFQYPKVHLFFETNFIRSSSILQFEDKVNFVSEIRINDNKVYWFASPLDIENSNFTTSPLIVPVFYNFSLQGTPVYNLFYVIGNKNEIIVKTDTKMQNVLHLSNSETDFIPLQNESTNYFKIQTEDNPIIEGLYQVKSGNNVLQNVAYNYNREESLLTYYPIDQLSKNMKNAEYFTTVENAIKKINDQNKNQNLWQLFVIFATIFLGIEIILQKFLKG
jgi:aerotolerance regulator-like protein